MSLRLVSLLKEYGVSHRNQTNKRIHNIFVPLITWSVLMLLWAIPPVKILGGIQVFYVVATLALFYYWKLDPKVFLAMFGVIALSAMSFVILSSMNVSLLNLGLAVFVIGWIFQFIGHKIEGKKPSFIQDLQFLLIGPIWVAINLGLFEHLRVQLSVKG